MVSSDIIISVVRRKGNTLKLATKHVVGKNKDEYESNIDSIMNEYRSIYGDSVRYKSVNFNMMIESDSPSMEIVDTQPLYLSDGDIIENVCQDDHEENNVGLSLDFKYAKDAIEYIDNNDVEASFIEGEERKTVIQAFNNKQNK